MANSDTQKVILVNEKDYQIGLEDKMAAHQNGAKLHRAISIFVFNSKGETMLQQRAMGKYHSQGKWSNTCCSHPMPNESVSDAAHRRLKEEMGFDCEMQEAFNFIYKADVGNGLTEHEYDHVLFGSYDGEPKLNKNEAMGFKWISLDRLEKDIKISPDEFTPWLRIAFDRVKASYKGKKA